ncbi:efflux pump antibiotic resistance protein [Rutstroemia sp. NJR-2017a BBW]|nr:efflux pump antibiotic resistance protein [Rutstroemia sp. NJR-2017a BBW]
MANCSRHYSTGGRHTSASVYSILYLWFGACNDINFQITRSRGASLQIISMAIQSLVPFNTGAGKYGFEILLSIGLGASMGMCVQLTPQLIRGKDQANAMGAITQFRALGGVVGLSIATNVFNDYVRSKLSMFLTPAQLSTLLQSVTSGIDELPSTLQPTVRSTFGAAYDLQTKVMIGFAVAQALAVSIMWEKRLRRLA